MKKLLFLIVLLILIIQPLSVASAEENVLSIPVSFFTSYSQVEASTFAFPYSDDWFSLPSDAYSHNLARASMGLTIAAFRGRQGEADHRIRSYLTRAGFCDLQENDYYKPTARDTIATMIGRKTLPGGETLIAVGVSGAGYQNEWLSNLDLGDEIEHIGFSDAAKKVVARIEHYIHSHDITGEIKIWISGYSRAAAVANLAGAALMRTNAFNEENTYVYTFASPNTTKAPVAHPNIFNILGKFDPATKLPFREWGYGRHGITLFTPAQETDSDYRAKAQKANAVFEQLTGWEFWNDPQVNHHFVIIGEYLLSIIPSSTFYHEHMRDQIAEIWKNPDLSSFRTLLDTLVNIETEDDLHNLERKERISDLTEYLYGLSYGIVTDRLFEDETNNQSELSAASMLIHEHDPCVYLAWLFSQDDPQALFSDNLSYTKLYIEGNADVYLFDQKGGFVFSMSPDGSISETTDNERYLKRIRGTEDRPLIYAQHTNNQNALILPKDQGMPFMLHVKEEGQLTYYGILYNVLDAAPSISSIRMIDAQEGEEYLAFSFTPDGMIRMQAGDHIWGDHHAIATLAQDGQLLSSIFSLSLDGVTEVTFSIRTLVLIILGVLLLIILLTAVLLFFLIRLLIRLLIRIISVFLRLSIRTRRG